MKTRVTPALTCDFLSSVRVFAKTVHDVYESTLLREVVGNKITLSQFKLLYLVAQADLVNIGDAAAFLGVSSPAASKSIEKLVRRHLLRRHDFQKDRRSCQLSLTETSRRLLATYEAARNRKALEVLEQCSPGELRHTSRLLDRLAVGIANQCENQDAVCMQCEIYFREECRFVKFGERYCRCFYRLHRSNQKDLRGTPSDPEQPFIRRPNAELRNP